METASSLIFIEYFVRLHAYLLILKSLFVNYHNFLWTSQYLNLLNSSGHGKRCLAHFVLVFIWFLLYRIASKAQLPRNQRFLYFFSIIWKPSQAFYAVAAIVALWNILWIVKLQKMISVFSSSKYLRWGPMEFSTIWQGNLSMKCWYIYRKMKVTLTYFVQGLYNQVRGILKPCGWFFGLFCPPPPPHVDHFTK